MDLLSLQHFAGAVNETFKASLGDVCLEFVLVEASPLPQSRPGSPREPFSLLFLNTSPVLFPQQIYQMTHPRVGQVGIFMTPIAQNRDGFVYQAVFN
ncbi:DUF6916 family protein [Aquimonas voraii]|uniref:DUF6916 domain-containing protein n=1 Tax=Aquimonas voraii TaxID=265719 RepID=A0A1G6UWK5_9GAMM|nr:hypothetical protein [Aquimonas voraii]SDD45702.1 hypothetical protein SAMN04488509_102528 [Aquimonas voraii]